ncbi:MAG: GMC family oxidoreductase N-terminal domain-containing protein [Actinobacteria bacterium]|nr:GMC family oxidoreductase N-terminal domain-containing protein [Actinomycetota bacterium]
MDRARETPRVGPVLAALARGALGDGYVPEVPERMLDGIAQLSSASDRKQLLASLRAMNTRSGALLLTGKPVPVSWLSQTQAEALLNKWRSSRIGLQRQLATGVLSLALSSLYGRPGPEWNRIGYQGPMGDAPKEPKRLSPLSIDHDEVLHCDVVIVGSGAGGGCVAGVLAGQGLDVVVLEKGGYRSESDFNHLEADASRDMYLYGMTLMNTDGNVRIIAGATLGGGTVVNYTTSFKTPDFVLDEWTRITGIEAFSSGEFEESLDEVSARLNVNLDSSAAGRRDELLETGLKKLGWHVDLLPRAVKGCTQDEQCGYCGFGCRPGAKQSTMRTYLEDAQAGGARIVTGADVRSVRIADGKATGVDAIVGPHRVTVTAKVVVVAAGSIETPALLLRSGWAAASDITSTCIPGPRLSASSTTTSGCGRARSRPVTRASSGTGTAATGRSSKLSPSIPEPGQPSSRGKARRLTGSGWSGTRTIRSARFSRGTRPTDGSRSPKTEVLGSRTS